MGKAIGLHDEVIVTASGQYQRLRGVVYKIHPASADGHPAILHVRFGPNVTTVLSENDVRKVSDSEK